MDTFLTELTKALIPVLIGFLLGLVKIGMNYLDAAAKKHLSEADANTMAKYRSMVDTTLTNLITASGETIVRELKAAGKWDKNAALSIKEHVLEQANTQLTDFREDIEGALLTDMPKYLSDRLEYVLATLRNEGTIRPLGPGGVIQAPPQN